jgi:phosphoglycolate phosphatase-like HAD superfamily hydrolase
VSSKSPDPSSPVSSAAASAAAPVVDAVEALAKAPGRLRAIVFDFDGVILESADVKTEAFLELYAEHGAELVAKVREHHLANLGISRFKKFAWIAEHLFGKQISEAESQALGERFSALALARVLAAPMVPGAQAALEQLADRLLLFVASGTPQGELDMIVEQRGLRRYFREVWGTPAEKPVIVRDLLARYSLTPDQVLFIGDGMSDHKAAMETGLHFLARSTPALREDWLKLDVRRADDLTTLIDDVATW